MDWRREEVLTLIGMYCQNTCLWDLEDPNYKNRELKREAILAIANELTRDVHDVEKKMHGLRTQFNREHKRYQKQVLLNGRLREVPKPTWFAYEPLEFVAKCINPRLPKIRPDVIDEFNYEVNSENDVNIHEASWAGFEIEVENDNGEITRSDIGLNSSSDCITGNEPEIIVECLEGHVVDNHRNSDGPLRSSETTIQSKRDTVGRGVTVDSEISRQLLLKRPRLMNERNGGVIDILNLPDYNQRTNKAASVGSSGGSARGGSGNSSGGGGSNATGSLSSCANTLTDTRDEYTTFAQYVQQELRKVSNPYALQVAKLKINQVLFEGTTGSYDRAQSKTIAIKPQHMVMTSKIQPYDSGQNQKVTGSLDVS